MFGCERRRRRRMWAAARALAKIARGLDSITTVEARERAIADEMQKRGEPYRLCSFLCPSVRSVLLRRLALLTVQCGWEKKGSRVWAAITGHMQSLKEEE